MSLLAALAVWGALLCVWGAPRDALHRRRLRGHHGAERRRRPDGRDSRVPRYVRPGVRVRRRREVLELADGTGAELAAGAVWEVALRRAAAAAAGDGGELGPRLVDAPDVALALRMCAELPGAEGLGALAAAGRLSERTGARASALVDSVADALRADDRARRAVAVELAPATSTTRLLAGLPVIGVLMGAALGADPLRVLVTTSAGRSCLLTALALEAAGLGWCRAIRRRALR